MPSIDYVIADQFVLPPELRVHFTEQAIYLPHCFQVSDSKREIGPLPSRASCNLPDEAFVFCSFNNNYKFRPEMFAVWMNILKAVPDSVLWLLADNEWAQANLCKAAESHGIPASRLVFAARVAPADYLARYQLADLFLDTTPFNAGTTANDALWMGLPLLTCVGNTFSSRMAGSLLNTLELPELICNNLHEYQLRAIALGNQRSETATLRRRLEGSRNTNALFNIGQFVEDLEHAFQGIAVHPANEQSTLESTQQHPPQHQQQRQEGTGMRPEDQLSTPSQSDIAAFSQRIVSDLTLAQRKMEQGLNQEARALYEQVLREVPNQQAAIEMLAILTQKEHIDAAMNRFPGPQYLKWLQWLHQLRKPASYVEIGVETGASLRFAQSPTKAVGIDPDIRITHTQESWVKLFKQTSDDFFASKDLAHILEGLPLDMAFIDGLHTFDQALRDFIHIERYAHAETVVAFHDIFPVTPVTAARERQSIFWLGDTWKVVLILKELRPDLKIITVPTFPSGLTLVTGLDSKSDVLALDMARIIEQWMPVECTSYMNDLPAQLNVVANDFDVVAALLHRR
jgi:predicted O-methyltransferase YrrM